MSGIHFFIFASCHPLSYFSICVPKAMQMCDDAACKTIYICKTIYFAYAKLYVLCTVYTSAYAKTYTFAKHIVMHIQNYLFCLSYEKLHILNKKATRIL